MYVKYSQIYFLAQRSYSLYSEVLLSKNSQPASQPACLALLSSTHASILLAGCSLPCDGPTDIHASGGSARTGVPMGKPAAKMHGDGFTLAPRVYNGYERCIVPLHSTTRINRSLGLSQWQLSQSVCFISDKRSHSPRSSILYYLRQELQNQARVTMLEKFGIWKEPEDKTSWLAPLPRPPQKKKRKAKQTAHNYAATPMIFNRKGARIISFNPPWSLL